MPEEMWEWKGDYSETLWVWIFDWPFIEINECLGKYEKTAETEMKLKKVNSLELYQ